MMLLALATLSACTCGVRKAFDLSASVQAVEVAGLQFVATGNNSKSRSFGDASSPQGHEELGVATVQELPGSDGRCCCGYKDGDMIAFDVPEDLAVGHTGLAKWALGARCPLIGFGSPWEDDPCACTVRENAGFLERAKHAAQYTAQNFNFDVNIGSSPWDAPLTCTFEGSVWSHSSDKMESEEEVGLCNQLCRVNRKSIFKACEDVHLQSVQNFQSWWGLDDSSMKELFGLSEEVRNRVMSTFSPTQGKGSDLGDECKHRLANLSQTSVIDFLTKLAIDWEADKINDQIFIASLTAFQTVQEEKNNYFKGTWFNEECKQAMDVASLVTQKYIIEKFKTIEHVEEEDFVTLVSVIDNVLKNRSWGDLEVEDASDEELGKAVKKTCTKKCSPKQSSKTHLKCVDKCCYTGCGKFSWEQPTCVTNCNGKKWKKPNHRLPEKKTEVPKFVQLANAKKEKKWIEPVFQPKHSKTKPIWKEGKASVVKENQRKK